MNWRFTLSRLGQMLLVLVVVGVATFVIGRLLPGDVATQTLGARATPERVAALRHELGLDRSVVAQFWDWATSAMTADLGLSLRTGIPVSESIGRSLPVSIELMLLAELVALGAAIPAAVLSAYRAGGWIDRVLKTSSFALLATPQFAVALVLVLVVAVQLRWLPATGFTPLLENPLRNLESMALPALTLAIALSARYYRVLRAQFSETLRQDFVLVAKAEGLSHRTILVKHALKPSMLTLTTVIGLDFGYLIGGALIVEQIFALPGMGSLALSSVLQRDFVLLQGSVLVIAAATVIVNFLVDVIYGLLDPRIRYGR